MIAADIIQYLESIAPPMYQESYDNSGLLVGDPNLEVTGAVISLDATEAVLEEAKSLGYNMVISHHPIIFGGLKSITGKTYIERVVMYAIKHDMIVYAIHTNLDNVLESGVNEVIAQKLELEDVRILKPMQAMVHCQIQCSSLLLENVREKLQAADIAMKEVQTDLGYYVNCHVPRHKLAQLKAVCGEYRLNAVEVSTLNKADDLGAGVIGRFDLPLTEAQFLDRVKTRMGAACIRHTELLGKSIGTVAICGGSGSFLLPDAIRSGADAFITGDFKYHQFFDADGHLVILDIGHFESEQFTINLLYNLMQEKFPNFAARCTSVQTNPVKYYL